MNNPAFYDAMKFDPHSYASLSENPDIRFGDMWVESLSGNFKMAYAELTHGCAVKRIGWLGYWIIHNGKLEVYGDDGSRHTYSASEIYSQLLSLTLKRDWMVMSPSCLDITERLFNHVRLINFMCGPGREMVLGFTENRE